MIESALSETKTAATRRPLPRPYVALLTAVGASGVGNGVVLVAFQLLASRLTHDTRLVSGVVVAETLPNLANLHIGAILDRVDRRRLVVVTEWVRCLVLGAFAIYVLVEPRPSIWTLFVTVFLAGLGQTIVYTASQVVVGELVTDDGQLARANGLLGSVEIGFELMTGQVLGGWLIAIAASLPFFVDSASFVASALLLGLAYPRRLPVAADAGPRPSVHRDILDGLRYFFADPTLRRIAGVISTFAACQGAVFGVQVVHLQRSAHLGDVGIGILMGVGAAGGVVGGVAAGWVDRHASVATTLTAAGVALAGMYLLFADSTTFGQAAVVLFLSGFAVACGNVASITLRQRVVPPDLLGRTMGATRFVIVGAFPLGALLGGWLGELGTTRTPILLAAGFQLLVIALLGGRLHAAVRGDERLRR